MKAYKLINTADNLSAFQEGTIPDAVLIEAHHFFILTEIAVYERSIHPAPRYQFVITLKGKLKFTVSNGTWFIIEPGIVLIAKDLHGEGHSWELIEGETWERIYIVPKADAEDHFEISDFI